MIFGVEMEKCGAHINFVYFFSKQIHNFIYCIFDIRILYFS